MANKNPADHKHLIWSLSLALSQSSNALDNSPINLSIIKGKIASQHGIIQKQLVFRRKG